MSPDVYLRRARRTAEARMLSRCKITRIKPESLDTATLDLTDSNPDDDLVYEGPCRVSSNSSALLTADAEGQLLTAQQLVLAIPIDAEVVEGGVRVRDEVEITDGGPDAALTGLKLRILGLPAATFASARRFPVEHTST
jgi:hypothetical protein